LKHEQTAGLLPDFHFIPLNGMELRHPLEIYIKLCSIMFPSRHKSPTVEMAERKLDLFFSGSAVSNNVNDQTSYNITSTQRKRQVFVLLLDEIDYMITKQQTVLYNFFEWPARSHQNISSPRLIVIGISNTQNLPERLHPRLQSRLASQRVLFNSYSVAETAKILEAKISQASQGYPVFQKEAIQFAAMKTGGLSGDLRKALVICRSAAEMVFSTANDNRPKGENSIGPTVKIQDLLAATNDPVNDAYIASVASVSSHQALVLIAIASLVKSIGRETDGFYIEEIHPKMVAIGDPTGNPMYTPVPDESITMDIVNRLSTDDMLKLYTTRGCTLTYDALLTGCAGTGTKISLPVDISTLLEGLRQSPHRELATKHIPRS
jgi:origin recognition complex subunit 1